VIALIEMKVITVIEMKGDSAHHDEGNCNREDKG
jgi:hypothetical protein